MTLSSFSLRFDPAEDIVHYCMRRSSLLASFELFQRFAFSNELIDMVDRPNDRPAAAAVKNNDAGLVRQAQQGDRAAFQLLVEKYQKRVFSVALGMVKNREDALDISQESFLKAFRHLPDFKGISSFYTWLYRICINLCLDLIRRRKGVTVEFDEKIALDESSSDAELLTSTPAKNPLAELSRKELAEQISKALDKLSPDHRAILLMREVEGLSYEEMAQVLGINKGTVMSRLFHARRNLRKLLIDYLAGEDGKAFT
jgi:RNA polymerase sigma-70 factor (ECF subfamily)